MSATQGFKARVLIDGVVFRVGKVRWRRERPKFEIPDSEDTAGDGTALGAVDGMAHVFGKGVCTITLEQATIDVAASPFAQVGFGAGTADARHSVVIIPDKAVPGTNFTASKVGFNIAECAADIAALQPTTLEGTVDGDCTLP